MSSRLGFAVGIIAWLLLPRGSAQEAPGAPPPAGPAPSAPAKPWRWADPDRKPFHAWHTDAAIQARLYDDASSRMQETVGVTLPAPIEVVILPAWSFFFVGMEVGAKDGSLFLDTSVSRAMEGLSFTPLSQAKPTSVGPDWRGDPESVAYFASGVYAPKHFRRMIFVSPDRSEDQIGAILSHELVHALQDEVYPFDPFFNFDGLTSDEKAARQAIEEGYATLVAGASQTAAAPRPAGSPDMLDWSARLGSLFYGAGKDLVERVSARAGSRRELLTLVFGTPPSTTREVLHPELYEQHLDTQKPLELPQPEAYVQLCDALAKALTEAGQPVAWRSRLGEFALQSLLIEWGMPTDEAAVTAASWRNDTVTTHGNWRQPTMVASVWCLADEDAAAGMAKRMRELMTARGAALVEAPACIQGAPTASATLDGTVLPQAVLIHSGTSVAFIVGQGLDGLVNQPPAR